MTIHTYYYTYGFLVPIDDCIALLGYTYDKLTDNIRKEIMDEEGFDEDDVAEFSEQHWVREWYESNSRNWEGRQQTFILDGVEFVLRPFTHNREEYRKFYLVGINLGEMGRFNGVYKNPVQPAELPKILITKLTQNEEWQKAIRKYKSKLVAFREKEYYVKISDDNWIIPEVHMTTDDCDCCS